MSGFTPSRCALCRDGLHPRPFCKGVVDLFTAIARFFPMLKLPLPGYASPTNPLAFVAGGWGIVALTFGIGRIWVPIDLNSM